MIAHSKPWITEEDIASVNACLRSNMIACGNKEEEFEERLSNYTGAHFAKAFSSGTSALVAALLALDVKKGDEVILPTYVCHEVMNAVLATGGSPVLCDIGQYWNATPENVSSQITNKTKAIIIIHSLGIRADAKTFLKFGLPVIEDCSQCMDKETGKHGCMAVYSFHATKCMATGEGGAVTTANQDLFNKLHRQQEQSGARMSDLQASLGLSQLDRYSEMLAMRKSIAEHYFRQIDAVHTHKFSKVRDHSIFYRFLLTSDKDFELVRSGMDKKGIAVRKGVDALLHKKYAYPAGSGFPNATAAFQNTVSIPIYPSLTAAEQTKIVEAINNVLK